jgi:hypothetical protein
MCECAPPAGVARGAFRGFVGEQERVPKVAAALGASRPRSVSPGRRPSFKWPPLSQATGGGSATERARWRGRLGDCSGRLPFGNREATKAASLQQKSSSRAASFAISKNRSSGVRSSEPRTSGRAICGQLRRPRCTSSGRGTGGRDYQQTNRGRGQGRGASKVVPP